MIPKEILKKIRRIQITTSRKVSNVFAGQYQSVFKGQGMEFHEVREYLPGDEIRSIDWNVTARMNQPYVKKLVEERELTVMFLLDASKYCHFGSVKQLKSELSAEVCSVLAFSAIRNNDKVGLVIFTDRIEKFIPPGKGVRHILRIIREMLYFKPKGKGTDISGALEYLNRIMRRKTISFVVSDFFDKGFKKLLSLSNKRHDVIAVTVTDPREIDLVNVGIVKVEDSESGKVDFIDTSNEKLRKKYRQDALERIDARKKLFRSINIDSIDINTDTEYEKELVKFFRTREKRFR